MDKSDGTSRPTNLPSEMPALDNSDVGAGATQGMWFIGCTMVILILLAIFGL